MEGRRPAVDANLNHSARVYGDCGSAFIPQLAPETRSQWEKNFSADLQLPSVLTVPPPCFNESSPSPPLAAGLTVVVVVDVAVDGGRTESCLGLANGY